MVNFWSYNKEKKFTADQVRDIATMAAGAASAVFLKDDPQKVVPVDEIQEAVNLILEEVGIEGWRY